MGIQVNLPHGPEIVAEVSFSLKGSLGCFLGLEFDGFISAHYDAPFTTRAEVDIIDLEERTMTRLSVRCNTSLATYPLKKSLVTSSPRVN